MTIVYAINYAFSPFEHVAELGDIFFRSTGQEVEFILLYLHRNQPIR
jgi:hypothetical protein